MIHDLIFFCIELEGNTYHSHLSFKKCTMKTNLFVLALNIRKSEFAMQELQDSRALTITFPWSYLPWTKESFIYHGLNKVSLTMVHLDGKMRQGFYLRTSLLKNGASIKENNTSSLIINITKSFSNYLWQESSLG